MPSCLCCCCIPFHRLALVDVMVNILPLRCIEDGID